MAHAMFPEEMGVGAGDSFGSVTPCSSSVASFSSVQKKQSVMKRAATRVKRAATRGRIPRGAMACDPGAYMAHDPGAYYMAHDPAAYMIDDAAAYFAHDMYSEEMGVGAGDSFGSVTTLSAVPAALAATPPTSFCGPEVNRRSLEAQSQEMQENKGGISSSNNVISTSSSTNSSIDFTNIPKKLNAAFEKFSEDEVYGGVMRTTTFKTGEYWRKSSQPNLLSSIKTKAFNMDEQKREKNKAFDLLDALSRSGSLPIACAELHIIVASTHSFEQSVVDTVVKKNVNPIEKIERSHLLVASLIHDVGLEKLLSSTHELKRIAGHSPLLLENSSTGGLVDRK
eukprot:1011684_1